LDPHRWYERRRPSAFFNSICDRLLSVPLVFRPSARRRKNGVRRVFLVYGISSCDLLLRRRADVLASLVFRPVADVVQFSFIQARAKITPAFTMGRERRRGTTDALFFRFRFRRLHGLDAAAF
jgi:hypothetical protein